MRQLQNIWSPLGFLILSGTIFSKFSTIELINELIERKWYKSGSSKIDSDKNLYSKSNGNTLRKLFQINQHSVYSFNRTFNNFEREHGCSRLEIFLKKMIIWLVTWPDILTLKYYKTKEGTRETYELILG